METENIAPLYKIAAIKVVDGHRSKAGYKLLAAFDLKVAGVTVESCLLVENPDGIVTSKGPTGTTAKGKEFSVKISNPVVCRNITRMAARAYTMLTGREVSDE